METEEICIICQDFKVNVGHETNLCPLSNKQDQVKDRDNPKRRKLTHDVDDQYPDRNELLFCCQNLKGNVGHEWIRCPKITCKKCGKKGHVKIVCMFGMEDLLLPNEILVKIISHLKIKDLNQLSQVSKRVNEICQNKLKYFHDYFISINELNSLIGSEAKAHFPSHSFHYWLSEAPKFFDDYAFYSAHPMAKTKDWHNISIIPDLRNHLVSRW